MQNWKFGCLSLVLESIFFFKETSQSVPFCVSQLILYRIYVDDSTTLYAQITFSTFYSESDKKVRGLILQILGVSTLTEATY